MLSCIVLWAKDRSALTAFRGETLTSAETRVDQDSQSLQLCGIEICLVFLSPMVGVSWKICASILPPKHHNATLLLFGAETVSPFLCCPPKKEPL